MTQNMKNNTWYTGSKRFSILTILLFAFLTLPAGQIHDFMSRSANVSFDAHAGANVAFKHGELVGALKPGVRVKDVANRHNLKMKKDHKENTYLFEIGDLRSVEQLLDEMGIDPDVLWVEPNYWAELDQVGSDQRSGAFIDQRSGGFISGLSPASFYGQYAVDLVRATEAHSITTGNGITVAVIDTGMDISHPAFSHVISGYDLVDNDHDPSETGSGGAYGHGTHVAGVVSLVAPDAMIMPMRAFDATGYGDISSIASAIRWAADHGADVINMSFSTDYKSSVLKSAIDYAALNGAVMAASAGNANSESNRYPGKYPEVLNVSATDQVDRKASFSNSGKETDVSAPGVSIYGPYPGGQWAWWDGTSFAAPMVSGEVALLLSIGRDVSRILTTAVPVQDSGMGSGRIDCYSAVTH